MWRLASALTAALLLAACSTTPDKQADKTSTSTDTQVETQTSGGQSGTTQGEKAEAGDVQQEKLDQGPKPGTQQDLVVEVGDRVFFAFDKSSLSAEAKKTIERLAAWMRENPGTTITIEGHADERGTREYNLALGARRANAVEDYLVALGIDPSRLQTVSYGEERPAVLGSNKEAWAKNRRAVFKVNQAAAGTS